VLGLPSPVVEYQSGYENRRDYSFDHRLLDRLHDQLHIPADLFNLLGAVADAVQHCFALKACDGHSQYAHYKEKRFKVMLYLLYQEGAEKNYQYDGK